TVHGRVLVPDREAEVRAIVVKLAQLGHQVVQVALGLAVHVVARGAVLAAALLPALPLVADGPRRHHMFPFDAPGAAGVLAHAVTAGLQIGLLAAVAAATIERGVEALVQVGQHLLGVPEIAMAHLARARDEPGGLGGQGCGKDQQYSIYSALHGARLYRPPLNRPRAAPAPCAPGIARRRPRPAWRCKPASGSPAGRNPPRCSLARRHGAAGRPPARPPRAAPGYRPARHRPTRACPAQWHSRPRTPCRNPVRRREKGGGSP